MHLVSRRRCSKKRSTSFFRGQRYKICTNKGRGVPLSAGSVVSSFCFSNDLLMVRWKRDVVEDGGALDEPMAKLLSVVQWPFVSGKEPNPRRRPTA